MGCEGTLRTRSGSRRLGRKGIAGKVFVITLFIHILVAASLSIAWCPIGETRDSETNDIPDP